MFLGLHSLLYWLFDVSKVKAATANISFNFAIFASDSLRSPAGSTGQSAEQISHG
jgi:hypothetical protein